MLRPFKKHEFIVEYTGEAIRQAVADEREKRFVCIHALYCPHHIVKVKHFLSGMHCNTKLAGATCFVWTVTGSLVRSMGQTTILKFFTA